MKNKTIRLIGKDKCTSCGLCMNICPSSCIKMIRDEYDNLYPFIDENKCVKCSKCFEICPSNNVNKFNSPKKLYCGYAIDKNKRENAASGGIASALYELYLRNNGVIAGVKMDEKFNAKFMISNKKNEFSNSKYVYSFIDELYSDEFINYVKSGVPILIIGLPCQISALKKFYNTDKNILFVDILCHGVGSDIYFKQHMNNISNSKKIDNICFRDRRLKKDFMMTLDSNKKIIYKKGPYSFDYYQFGYHKALYYRENCYKCIYAQNARVGDITIGDYFTYGLLDGKKKINPRISMVLSNTEKGEKILKRLQSDKIAYLEDRPIKEALKYIDQLNQPSKKYKTRKVFLEEYKKNKNFEEGAR